LVAAGRAGFSIERRWFFSTHCLAHFLISQTPGLLFRRGKGFQMRAGCFPFRNGTSKIGGLQFSKSQPVLFSFFRLPINF
jgi:hypothetical protein